jgi:predicted DNA-binding protein (MmcQ/YjbR family)
MKYDDIKKHCLALPGVTVNRQWGNDYVFKVGGKMFAVYGMDKKTFHGMSFKVADDSFEILTQMPSIIPAPYMARAKWVMLEKATALPAKDIKAYLTRAHAIIAAKLPKKTRAQLKIEDPA